MFTLNSGAVQVTIGVPAIPSITKIAGTNALYEHSRFPGLLLRPLASDAVAKTCNGLLFVSDQFPTIALGYVGLAHRQLIAGVIDLGAVSSTRSHTNGAESVVYIDPGMYVQSVYNTAYEQPGWLIAERRWRNQLRTGTVGPLVPATAGVYFCMEIVTAADDGVFFSGGDADSFTETTDLIDLKGFTDEGAGAFGYLYSEMILGPMSAFLTNPQVKEAILATFPSEIQASASALYESQVEAEKTVEGDRNISIRFVYDFKSNTFGVCRPAYTATPINLEYEYYAVPTPLDDDGTFNGGNSLTMVPATHAPGSTTRSLFSVSDAAMGERFGRTIVMNSFATNLRPLAGVLNGVDVSMLDWAQRPNRPAVDVRNETTGSMLDAICDQTAAVTTINSPGGAAVTKQGALDSTNDPVAELLTLLGKKASRAPSVVSGAPSVIESFLSRLGKKVLDTA